MQKIEEPELLKQTKKARQAAVARKDLSGRNADRMMKLVRTRIKIEVMATLYEGYEEVTKMAVEAEALFLEAGDPAKSQDAHVTKVVCDDLQQAAILAASDDGRGMSSAARVERGMSTAGRGMSTAARAGVET
jgi:hypothetical protein